MISSYVIAVIVISMLVTWVPRVFPYILVRFAELPPKVIKFLGYLPITIIFALILSSIFTVEKGHLPQIKWIELVAVAPTFLVVAKSKNVMLAVLIGVAAVAVLRLGF